MVKAAGAPEPGSAGLTQPGGNFGQAALLRRGMDAGQAADSSPA